MATENININNDDAHTSTVHIELETTNSPMEGVTDNSSTPAPTPTIERQPNEIFRAMMDFGIDFDLAFEHEIDKFVRKSIVLCFDQDGKKITDPSVIGISDSVADEPAKKALSLCYLQTEPFTTDSFLATRVHLEKFASRLKNIHLRGHLFSLPWSMEMNAFWSCFTNAKVISLRNSGLTCFPTVLFRLPKLENLFLDGNPITTLDWTKDDVKDSKLETISLNNTNIQKLQESLVWPETLEGLCFDHVETLTEIECTFPKSLDKLILRGTRIADAPKSIQYIKGLLLAENPNLTVLHLESAQCLVKLDVRECPNLTDIEFTGDNDVSASSVLEAVVADKCGFTQIPSSLSSFARSLEFLSFEFNNITEIPIWLKDASGLQYLDVGNNHITSFPEEIVPGLSELRILKLQNNSQMNSLPVAAMCEHMKRLSQCTIEGTAVSYDDGKKLEEHCQKQRSRIGGLLDKLLGGRNRSTDDNSGNGDGNGNGDADESPECSIC